MHTKMIHPCETIKKHKGYSCNSAQVCTSKSVARNQTKLLQYLCLRRGWYKLQQYSSVRWDEEEFHSWCLVCTSWLLDHSRNRLHRRQMYIRCSRSWHQICSMKPKGPQSTVAVEFNDFEFELLPTKSVFSHRG